MISAYLSSQWTTLCRHFTFDETVINRHFAHITQAYNELHRSYHTPDHVAQLLHLIDEYAEHLQTIHAARFAAFFHDVVYVPGESTNERDSARLAVTALKALQVPDRVINDCEQMILLTKSHANVDESVTADMLLFLDMDLSILGAAPEAYEAYRHQVRAEFTKFPDLLFKQGRRSFLKSQLQRPLIFHTALFRRRYEVQARENMLHELNIL